MKFIMVDHILASLEYCIYSSLWMWLCLDDRAIVGNCSHNMHVIASYRGFFVFF